MEYAPKELEFATQAQKRLADGIDKMARAVKSTLGPNGNTVLIESPQHTHGITVTKDGVTVAKAIDLLDPIENLAVKMMKEAADKTATSAGDGTTTAIVLTEALVKSGMELIEPSMNRTAVLRSLVEMSGMVVDNLKDRAKKLTNKMLVDVATHLLLPEAEEDEVVRLSVELTLLLWSQGYRRIDGDEDFFLQDGSQ